MGIRDSWAKSFDLGKTQLYPLESCDIRLYITKDVIHTGPCIGNEDPHGRLPIYHVWDGDKHVYCGQSMQYAYKMYRKLLNDAMNRAAT